MRSEDEEEEDDYDEENEDDEMDLTQNQGDENDEEDNSGEVDGEGDAEADGEAEGEGEGDGEEEGEGDEEDVDGEGEGDGEGSDEQAGGDEEDDEEDVEDGDDDDEEDEADDGDGDEDEEDDGDEDDGMEPPSSPVGSRTSTSPVPPKRPLSPSSPPLPPHKIRRSLLVPSFPSPLPTALTVDAIVAIPSPAPIHCLASTACSSYLLTGSQEGVIRAYDFYASVNGSQAMTSQQRAVIGMGETISKVGVGRGWWVSDVATEPSGSERRSEPVYSLAVEGDGLWTLTGTQSGQINLYTLRHSPGHLIHSLKGHTSVVSCMSLTMDEKHLLSGSWDGSIREWDLNTGQTNRTFPTHGAQLSSLSHRPYSHPISPPISPQRQEIEDEEMADKPKVSVNVGADFFVADRENHPATGRDSSVTVQEDPAAAATQPPGDTTAADVNMEKPSRASSYDPLFDDEDAEGEEVPPPAVPTKPNSPVPASNQPTAGPSRQPLNLALPQINGHKANGSALPTTTPAAARPAGAAATIPLLSSTSFKQFSDDIALASFMDGQVMLIDKRVQGGGGVGRLTPGDKAPPWCMSACWSGNGNQVLAGRRNGTMDIWDVRKSSSTSTAPNLLRTLRTPAESGPISCVVAFPDGQHVATASQDNIRLWNTVEYFEPEESMKKARSRPPFKIVAGHHGGTVSSMLVDPTCRFLTVASGDRGWAGESTKVVLIHEIKW